MRVVIFEDEIHNAERLKQLLHNCNEDIEVIATLESLAEGKKWLAQKVKVDLMLMDIQLSDGNCFELFEDANVKTPIIFTTAYDSFALQAFKLNSIDYLMKPIDQKELKNALKKFEQFKPTEQHDFDLSKLADAFLKRDNTRFIGKLNNQLIYVKAKDIAYVQFIKGLTYATTFDGQKLPIDYSLDQVEKMLDKTEFFRINRQFIIHIDSIKKITAYYNSRLILQLNPHVDTDIIISRERVADFKNWLEGKESQW